MREGKGNFAPPLKPPSRSRFVIAALLAPIMLAFALHWLVQDYRRSEALRDDVSRSFNRQISQISLLSNLKDVEAAQRGYVLTGDPVFLAPYEPARRAIQAQIAREIRDPDVPRGYPGTIRRLTERQLADLDRPIARARAGDLADARAMIAAGTEPHSMNRLRAIIGDMIDYERTRLEARQARYLADRGWLHGVVLSVTGGLALAVIAFLYFFWRNRHQRHVLLVAAFEVAARHETILNSTIDAILILNPSGTVETMNAAATRMLGYQEAERDRCDIAAILDLAPGEGSFHERIGLIDGRLRQSFLSNRTARHSDGHDVAVDIAMGVMRLPSGDHIVVSLRDISERLRMERVKDDLISTVSHELRTPLTSIVGSLGLLRANVAGKFPRKAEHLIEIAENNSRRLIRLINDMLDIDRIESGSLEMVRRPIDLHTVLAEACIGSEGLARANDVTIECPDRGPPVMVSGDAERLLQVVTNLLSNAIHAAPRGSTVDLGLRVAGAHAAITVDDRGSGIPPAFHHRIFGRFERAAHHEPAGAIGTGLGLAISREIVTRHDGTIRFEDRLGGGTRFVVSLLLLGAAARRDAAAPIVLIAEPDDNLARVLVALVMAEGCAYEVVRSAAAAEQALARRDYAALLVGLALPDRGGLDFAHALRDANAPIDAPIIVIAASAFGQWKVSSGLDVVDWIDKPGDPGRLCAALRIALSRTNARQPVILHLDDDHDLRAVVAAALAPEARIVSAQDLPSARALLATMSPDVVILDVELAEGSGLDLIPFLIDERGLAIPTIIYSARDVGTELAGQVDAVLVKARGSIPDLKATIRRVVRDRIAAMEAA